jgi:hypothetical protein
VCSEKVKCSADDKAPDKANSRENGCNPHIIRIAKAGNKPSGQQQGRNEANGYVRGCLG